MRKVLITGSTGFIGKHLLVKLLESGYKVKCFVREGSNLSILKGKNAEIIRGSYTDFDSMREALNDVEIVFHLAALLNGKSREEYFKANVESTKNLISVYESLPRGNRKFVFISSIAASGPAFNGELKTEKESDNPVSFYGESKLLAEESVKNGAGNIDYVILRPPNIYGPSQREMFTLIRVIQKRILPLLGNKNSKTSLLYVEDIVNAIILAGECEAANNKTYFVTDNRAYTWRKTVKLISKALGVYPFVIPIPGWILTIAAWKLGILSKIFGFDLPFRTKDLQSIRKNRWTFDGTAFMKATGFEPQISLKDGIKKTIELLKNKKK